MTPGVLRYRCLELGNDGATVVSDVAGAPPPPVNAAANAGPSMSLGSQAIDHCETSVVHAYAGERPPHRWDAVGPQRRFCEQAVSRLNRKPSCRSHFSAHGVPRRSSSRHDGLASAGVIIARDHFAGVTVTVIHVEREEVMGWCERHCNAYRDDTFYRAGRPLSAAVLRSALTEHGGADVATSSIPSSGAVNCEFKQGPAVLLLGAYSGGATSSAHSAGLFLTDASKASKSAWPCSSSG